MWAEVILNTEQTFFDGKFVINTNMFTQLFSADGPTTDLLFFFNFVSSPLYCLISPLFSVLSLMSQNSPNSHPRNEKTHPSQQQTKNRKNGFS